MRLRPSRPAVTTAAATPIASAQSPHARHAQTANALSPNADELRVARTDDALKLATQLDAIADKQQGMRLDLEAMSRIVGQVVRLRALGHEMVVVSSGAHHMEHIDFADLNFEGRGYSPWRAYAQSKLANLLFALELQRRLRAAGAAVQAETCDECHHYLKIVHSDRDPFVDPVADDLASLTLDLLVSETGMVRHGVNLMLLFGEPEAPPGAPPDPGAA